MKRALLALFLFITAVVFSYLAVEAYATNVIREKVRKRVSKLPVSVIYRGPDYNLYKNEVTFSDLTLFSEDFRFEAQRVSLKLPFTLRKKELPSFLRLEIEGAILKVPALKPLLSNLGIDLSGLPFSLKAEYTIGENRISGVFGLSVYKMGKLAGSFELLGDKASLKRFMEGRITLDGLLKKLHLKECVVLYKDKGLVEGFISYTARQEKADVKKVKEELIRLVESGMREKPVLLERVGRGLVDFLKTPKCVRLTIKPEEPVNLLRLKGLLKRRLNVEEVIKFLNLRLKSCS